MDRSDPNLPITETFIGETDFVLAAIVQHRIKEVRIGNLKFTLQKICNSRLFCMENPSQFGFSKDITDVALVFEKGSKNYEAMCELLTKNATYLRPLSKAELEFSMFLIPSLS